MSVTRQPGLARFYNNRTIKKITKCCNVELIFKGMEVRKILYNLVVWNIIEHDHRSAIKLLGLIDRNRDSFDETITHTLQFIKDVRYLKRIIDMWIDVMNKRHPELTGHDLVDFAYCLEPEIHNKTKLLKWLCPKMVSAFNPHNFTKWNLKKAAASGNVKIVSYLNKKYPKFINKIIEQSYLDRWVTHSDEYKVYYTVKSNLRLEYERDPDSSSISIDRVEKYDPYLLFNTICRRIMTKNLTKLVSYYVFTY